MAISKNKILIGTDIHNDLVSIGISECEVKTMTTFDLQNVFRDVNNDPMSLSFLSKHFLGFDLQTRNQHHCSIKDARLTFMINKRWERFQCIHPTLLIYSCPELTKERKDYVRPKFPPGSFKEKCNCGAKLGTKKKTPKTLFSTISNFKNCNSKMFLQEWEFSTPQNNAIDDDEW